MATVEYTRPNGDTVTVDVRDYQMNKFGALALDFEGSETQLLSPETEWVVYNE